MPHETADPVPSDSSAAPPPAGSPPAASPPSASSPAGSVERLRTTRVVAVAAIALALSAPGQTAGLSVLIDPIIEELDVSRSLVSAAYMCGTLTGALAMPAVGAAVDRYGPRRMLAAVAVVFGGVLLAATLVSNLIGLTLAFVGLRMAGQGALSLVATTTVAVYVHRRLGFAQGVTSACGAAGISLAPVLLETLAAEHGFRTIWVIEGLAIWAIAIPLAIVGLPKPAGRPRAAAQGRRTRVETAPGDWAPRQARRTAFFWVVAVAISAVAMLATAVNFHQITLLGERGLSPTEAAANFLPQTIAGLAATILGGMLADRVPPRVIIVFCMGALGTALAAGGYVQPGWSALAFGAALGIAGNGLRVLEATAFPKTFGRSHVGAIRGYLVSTTVAASAFGPVVFALGRDWAGSYRPVLLVSAAFPVAVAIVAAFTKPPSGLPPGK